jgi:hypothetical protein
LQRPIRYTIEEELTQMGIPKEDASNVLKDLGLEGVLALAASVQLPSLVGHAYAQINETDDFPNLFVEAINSEGQHNWDFAHGAIVTYLHKYGDLWANKLVDRAFAEKWNREAQVRLFLSLPKSEHFLQRVAVIGGEIEEKHWRQIPIYAISIPNNSVPWVIERLLAANRAYHATHYAGQHVKDVPAKLLIRVLGEAVQAEPSKESNDNVMFQHFVEKIFEKLDNDSAVTESEIARLEWAYLKLLEFSNRSPRTLPKLLATSPQFFVEVLSTAFKANHDEKGLDPDAPDYQVRASMATQAWSLFHNWSHVPGLRDGKIEGSDLEKWIREARILSANADRAEIGDVQIGQVLAHAPTDADGTWPCIPVREIIEITRSTELENGIHTGVFNKRGVTTRSPTDGGIQERALAHTYRTWSEKTRLEYPRTSALLAKIAEGYEWDAKHHDNDAERNQW